MEFRIHDVGHGFCASVVAENGNTLLFDCGHGENFHPSLDLPRRGWRGVEYLFITNFDEDHISDLPQVLDRLPVDWVYRNPTISAPALRAIKLQSGPISPAMDALLELMASLDREGEGGGALPPIPGVSFRTYWNEFPGFVDTNNLSLVVAVDIGPLHVLIPGDLEASGWRSLLRRTDFQADLRRINLLIASHHGRESGYCAEVFEHCYPDLIVFSDSPVVHASQEMATTYRSHASGAEFGGEMRRVVSTRKDHEMWWRV